MQHKIYCAGLFRTGTNTMYEMFRRSFRSAHEFMLMPSLAAVEAWAKGDLSRAEFAAFACERDRSGNLDMDSSGLNFAFLDLFLEMHPEARIVLTIRDCYSWLNSSIGVFYRINGRRNAEVLSQFVNSLDYAPDGSMRWSDRRAYKPCLRQMLRTWAAANQYALRRIPRDRLLVLDTSDLDQAVEAVARFSGVPADALDAHHANGGYGIDYLACFPREAIERLVEENCALLMKERFPHRLEWRPPKRDLDVPAPDPVAVREAFSLGRFEPYCGAGSNRSAKI